MRNIAILIGSRLINGVFGLLLFLFLKKVIDNDAYDLFSSSYANLTLISAFAGGVLGGLLLKNAFHFGTEHHNLVYFYVVFFGLLMVLPIEAAFYFNAFKQLSRFTVYTFMLSHLLCAVILVHFQLRQKFVKMAFIEISRTLIPLIIVLVGSKSLSINEVIFLLAIGNIGGVIFLIQSALLRVEQEKVGIVSYLKAKFKPDLAFGFSFGSFNALAQFVIANDRGIIVSQGVSQGSNVAYTADQVTKATNGILFPLNTKVSSELGGLIRSNETQRFHKQLYRYTLLTLVAGAFLTLPIYAFVWFYGDLKLVNDLNKEAILYYGFANTVYLASLVYQKRFDYTKYKLLPTLLLLAACAIAYGCIQIYSQLNYFFLTAMLFGLSLIAASFVLPNNTLVLNK